MDLTKQLEDLQHELNVENQKGGLRNGAVIETLEQQIAEVKARIEEQEQEKEAEVVNEQVAKFMDSLDFEGVEPKELFINAGPEAANASYNYVNTVIQNAVVAMKKADLQRIKELEMANANLTDKAALLADDNERLSQGMYSKQLEISDLENRLKNAVAQLEEEREEVRRLNSQVDDLRKEIAVGAAASEQVVELDTRSAREKWLEQKKKEEESKPVIYGVEWEDDIKRTHKIAKMAETDEKIRFHYFEEGKYRVVSEAEAETFRNAYKSAQEQMEADRSGTVAVETEPVTSSFRDEEDTNGELGLVEETSAVVGSVSREEFTTLKAEVAAINAYLGRY